MMLAPGPVVEVAGVDGAGKTTLAAHLSGHYIAQGRITYVRSFHTWIRRWTTAVAAQHGRSRAEHFGLDAIEFATAVELMDRSQLLRRSAADGSLFVLDPYIFCSAAMSASYGVTNLAAIVETYLAGAPPDLVVYLEIDPRVAMERIGRRVSNDNLVLPAYQEPSLAAFRDALEEVAPMFATGGVEILRLDAESTVEANVKAVADRLADLGF
jgi:thymidylate kinase